VKYDLHTYDGVCHPADAKDESAVGVLDLFRPKLEQCFRLARMKALLGPLQVSHADNSTKSRALTGAIIMYFLINDTGNQHCGG